MDEALLETEALRCGSLSTGHEFGVSGEMKPFNSLLTTASGIALRVKGPRWAKT